MNPFFLPPDDQVSSLTSSDRAFLSQLEEAVSDRFYASSDPTTQKLLGECQWSIDLSFDIPLFTICCPSHQIYQHTLDNIESIQNCLSRIIPAGQIKVMLENRDNLHIENLDFQNFDSEDLDFENLDPLVVQKSAERIGIGEVSSETGSG